MLTALFLQLLLSCSCTQFQQTGHETEGPEADC